MNINVQEIMENCKGDPSLLSTLNIDEILEAVEKDKHEYLDNKTLDTISQEIFESINSLGITKEKQKEICEKLLEYRYVDELFELHRGKFVRWIRKTNPEILTNGGIVVDVKFLDNGINILVKISSIPRFIQYRFDDCLSFQKLSQEEQLILMAYEIINKE